MEKYTLPKKKNFCKRNTLRNCKKFVCSPNECKGYFQKLKKEDEEKMKTVFKKLEEMKYSQNTFECWKASELSQFFNYKKNVFYEIVDFCKKKSLIDNLSFHFMKTCDDYLLSRLACRHVLDECRKNNVNKKWAKYFFYFS